MKLIIKCNCGGNLIARKFIEMKEGESYKEFARRIEFIEEKRIWVRKCDKCLRLTLKQTK
mgnify:CR=1 FL=1|jgi:hypothetical protein|tara:strand:+ start:1377 stop:1556 length:180 start_codon:yes stop_codon:yes gene_type:complete